MRRSAADASSLTLPSSRIVLSMRVFERLRRDQDVEQRREHGANDRRAPGVAERRLRAPRRAQQRGGRGELETAPDAADHAQARERRGEIRGRLGTPRLVAGDRFAHRGDARVLAIEVRRVGRRRERANTRRAEVGRGKPATTSSTRGNSRTDSACEFILRPPPPNASSPNSSGRARRSRRQLLADDGVDRAALRASLELGHDLAHHRTDVRRAAVDRRDHRGADLVVAHTCWKIGTERLDFRAFDRREVGAARPCRTSRSTRDDA